MLTKRLQLLGDFVRGSVLGALSLEPTWGTQTTIMLCPQPLRQVDAYGYIRLKFCLIPMHCFILHHLFLCNFMAIDGKISRQWGLDRHSD